MDAVMLRAQQASQKKADAAERSKWNARTRVARYTPALPMKAPLVWKFYLHPPGQWVFVAADTRDEVRKHHLYKPRERVMQASPRDLNELAKAALACYGGTLVRGPERMRSKTKGHQAVRTNK
jgi:hypothetical protein